MKQLFAFNHRHLGFQGFLQDGEVIEETFRRTFGPIFTRMIFWGIVYGGGAIAAWFFFPQFPWGWGVLAIFAVLKMFRTFLDWYLNAILMTTDNLIFVEWMGFFKKKSMRIDYWNIDGIEVMRTGLNAFLSNYGDLTFMGLNGGVLYQASKMGRPQRTAQTIEAYREKQVDVKNFTEESALKNLLSGMVQRHVGENGQPERGEEEPSTLKPQALDLETEKEEEPKVSIITKKFKPDSMVIEVEKELDDEGGIGLDL